MFPGTEGFMMAIQNQIAGTRNYRKVMLKDAEKGVSPEDAGIREKQSNISSMDMLSLRKGAMMLEEFCIWN